MHQKLSKSVDTQQSYNPLKVMHFWFFYETQQNSTTLSITVSRGSAATNFRCGG